MEDENNILIKDYIVKAISFIGAISGTTDILVDEAALFGKIVLSKINFKIKTGSQETHVVCWREDLVQVTKSSNVSDPEIFCQDEIRKYENNDLFISLNSIFKSVKTAMWLKEGGDDEPVVDPVSGMSSKDTSYLESLQQMEISQNTPAQISDFETAPCTSDTFRLNWARYT